MSQESRFESFVEEVIGEVQESRRRVSAEWQPWHRARKQFVRIEQWVAQVSEYVDELDLGETPLSYLSLPGDDFLDVRVLHDKVCVPRGLKLRFLGFNSLAARQSEGGHFHQQLYAVKRLEQVMGEHSDVVPDQIQSVSVPDSLARESIERAQDIHVINVDLCGAIHAPVPNVMPNIFDCLRFLVQHQSRMRGPSLFMLTSRVDELRDSGRVALDAFTRLIEDNETSCTPFQENLSAIRAGSADGRLSPLHHFIVGVSKWLLSVAHPYGLGVTVVDLLSYRVKHDDGSLTALDDDMVSLVFKLSPLSEPILDPAGLGNLGTSRGGSECEWAGPMPQALHALRCIDDLLFLNPEVAQHWRDSTEALLSSADFDTTGYQEWDREWFEFRRGARLGA